MPNGQWVTDLVAGHPCDIYEPARRNPHNFVVLYLHGVHLTRLTDNIVFTGEFARCGLPVVAPLTQRSWWTDKICREFDAKLTAQRHVLENVLPLIAARFDARPPRIGLLGTSMGGQGALRLAYKFPNVFPVVAAISPAVDYQMRWQGDETLMQMYADAEAARQDTATLHVHPLNWPRQQWFCCDPTDYRWHASVEKLRMKLAALGIPHQHDLETSAGGHSFEYYNHMAPRAVAFIAEALERERRRV